MDRGVRKIKTLNNRNGKKRGENWGVEGHQLFASFNFYY